MTTEHQRVLRERYPAAPVMPAPAPWRPVGDGPTPVGGLLGMGFAVHPETGRDLVMVVSTSDRVILSASGNINTGPPGGTWWHVFQSTHSEFRAAGFSPTGHTLAVATSSDLTLWSTDGHD
ncbi:hypothetical protein [Streptomyces sp. NPDC027717]|uniref:hypothetical protein n=1 Tax=Streptomyces sp. NPDC027717 TaxID=3155765 RepID=UPI0033CBA80A